MWNEVYNSLFFWYNFDIEIFIEREKSISTNDVIETSKFWEQLDFKKQKIEVKNGILLDEPEVSQVKDNANLVEHYFDLTIDDEIYDTPSVTANRSTYLSNITDTDKPFGNDC